MPPVTSSNKPINQPTQVTAVDISNDKEAEAKQLGASSFVAFDKAFTECRGKFDVVLNCVSASIDSAGVLGMLGPDGVAVQVRGACPDEACTCGALSQAALSVLA
jgi:D-arabinose 1-dehydrogenase-like Zn-dependent alcohol dehydrogenase